MKKRLITVLMVACAVGTASFGMDAYRDSAAFNPETSSFSKMETIKTWVAPHHNQTTHQEIQGNVAMTVKENPFSVHFAMPVQNDPGVTTYFGKSFPTIPAIELPFLQWVREVSANNQNPVTMELAASMGLVSWKVPFAFPETVGMHYANELSHFMMDNVFPQMMDVRLKNHPELMEKVMRLPGDCFDIPQHYPALLGEVKALSVQNLEHFLNAETHPKFIGLIESLLAPGGRAFLCSHSFMFGTDPNHPLRALYSERKQMGDLYPGFAEYDVTFTSIKGAQMQVGDPEISNVSRPADDAEFVKIDKAEKDAGVMFYSPAGRHVPLQKSTQHIFMNSFSPSIYRGVVAKFPSLRVVDTFFIEKANTRVDQWGDGISHAAVIIEKIDTDENENKMDEN